MTIDICLGQYDRLQQRFTYRGMPSSGGVGSDGRDGSGRGDVVGY